MNHTHQTPSLVGAKSPEFTLPCVDAQTDQTVWKSLADYRGHWLMLLFYPRDFSFVCPTELTSFSLRMSDFQQRNCDLLGISVDTIESHAEWLNTPVTAGGIGRLKFPLASDVDAKVSQAFGVWDAENRVSTRGLFIIDPDGVLQYSVIHNLNVGRNVSEVLRVLDALETGGLCPASWTTADGTIDPEKGLQPGRVLGHYRIRESLGNGTFGSVFSAWDLQLQRPVALKILKRNISDSRANLLNEARTAAKLNHPNVCTIYAVEEDNGLPVIVMELIEGRPLSAHIAEGLEQDEALRLAFGIAGGLASAHAHEVIHGDLKPANVFVSVDGIPKILDFGLARTQSTDAAVHLAEEPAYTGPVSAGLPVTDGNPDATLILPTSSQTVRGSDEVRISGTPAYMSPEQATGKCATMASDVFSFGLVFYELLTGTRGLSEDSVVKVLAKLRSPELAHELTAGVDENFRDLLRAMLSHDPRQRPTIAAVIDSLTDLLA